MNKVLILVLVVLVVLAGVFFMVINGSDETENNNATTEAQNTQNMSYSQDTNPYSTPSQSSGGSNSEKVA